MAHFAKLDSTNHVEKVIVAEQEYVDTLEGTWVQTSYNTIKGVHQLGGTPLRWNYAGIGHYYNSDMDEFHPPQPYNSWAFDTTERVWNPPIEKPEGNYYWDEKTHQADNTQGWIEIT
jgi:hypothetical protein